MLAAPHWIPGSSRADRGLAGRRELGAEAGASFPSFAAAASEMDWKCEVSSCPRCVLDVFKASSSVLRGGRRKCPGGSKDYALSEHHKVDHYNPSEDDNLSGGKVAVPIEGIRKALANVLKELGKTRVEDDGFPIKYMSFHGTLNKILNIHAPGELLVIIKSGLQVQLLFSISLFTFHYIMYSHPTVAMRPNLPAPPTDDPISSLHLPAALTSILPPPLLPPPWPFPLRGLAHFLQMKFSGTSSKSLIPEHLVCCQTPHMSHASIRSPSSSLAPHEQSTVQFSKPLSILNCTILR
ncbi:hypothetical protein U9M48_016973 [Paspalum notatum var. saurae]|uniref:Uncharacterized protein n=1 Tax=Paspalum notatum var. saurae TaxID=547442 RepID=A0AAQ3T6M4_PASNO